MKKIINALYQYYIKPVKITAMCSLLLILSLSRCHWPNRNSLQKYNCPNLIINKINNNEDSFIIISGSICNQFDVPFKESTVTFYSDTAFSQLIKPEINNEQDFVFYSKKEIKSVKVYCTGRSYSWRVKTEPGAYNLKIRLCINPIE